MRSVMIIYLLSGRVHGAFDTVILYNTRIHNFTIEYYMISSAVSV